MIFTLRPRKFRVSAKVSTQIRFTKRKRLPQNRQVRHDLHDDRQRGEGARATSRTQTETERTAAEGRMAISLTVQPRVQREKWSLYWKESMMTKTDVLDPVVLSVDENKTKVGSGDSEHSSASTRSSRNDPPAADD